MNFTILQMARTGRDCPLLLPPNPTTSNYHLHINVPTNVRPKLTLQAINLGPIVELFDASLIECVICIRDCNIEENIVFRLEARLSSLHGDETSSSSLNSGVRPSSIACLGETVSLFSL